MMQQLEAAFGGVWVGGTTEMRPSAYSRRASIVGGFRTSPPADRLSPVVLVSLCGGLREEGWQAYAWCMQYLLHPKWQPIFGRPAQRDRAFPSQIQ